MFKPNISPTYLDQMKMTSLTVKTEKSGERVIVDPEATTERAVLWFYLLINVGAFMGVPATYAEKYVGWALTFGIPLALWVFLPLVLFWCKKRLILHPPGKQIFPWKGYFLLEVENLRAIKEALCLIVLSPRQLPSFGLSAGSTN
jgi:hypothetical protein